LINLLKYTLQLRNSMPGTNEDYILSCVKGKDGKFFDSRVARKNKFNAPWDADANGAYHIGLKGLMLVERIKQSESGKEKLAISNSDFFNYVIFRNL